VQHVGVPEAPEFASKVTLYFRVDDIEAEYARLAAAGVPMIDKPHPVHRGGGSELWMAFFTDPDGHHLAVMQDRRTAG
jgi:predicted enzyme related to lactoylglutathione lyase